MLLAGDVGGTKTLLGLFEPAERPATIDVRAYPTLEFDSLDEMVAEFMGQQTGSHQRLSAASFGVAGPVLGTRARLTNVDWEVDAEVIRGRFGVPRVALLNDLVAMAYAVPVLQEDELAVLQVGEVKTLGNAALIAAGTGLGQALLHQVDGRFVPSPTEGGHADFAARNEREFALVRDLIRWYGRASCEHVISGPGLLNVHRSLHNGVPCEALPADCVSADAPALISQSAIEHRCEACVQTLDTFVSAYGAESGNLALRSLATAGVYLGGGIAPKILPALQSGAFMKAFLAKPPMDELLAHMPVRVILNPAAGLLGAAAHATVATEVHKTARQATRG